MPVCTQAFDGAAAAAIFSGTRYVQPSRTSNTHICQSLAQALLLSALVNDDLQQHLTYVNNLQRLLCTQHPHRCDFLNDHICGALCMQLCLCRLLT